MAKSEFNLEPLRTDFDPHQDMLRGFDLALSQVPEVDYSEFTTPADPVDWMEAHFRIPETDDKRLRLAPYQKRMIREMLSTDENGNFKYSVILWSDIKKSIKSTITAAVALWRAFQVDWGQIVLVANDLKQANSRVGYYARRAIQLHPGLRAICQVIQTEIRFPNHTIIESIPIDPSGEAGGNADMVVFSELWGAHQAAQKRMWTEATLSPTKFGRSFRMIETYAGFNGESDLLENLYEQGITNGAPFDWCKEFDPPLAAYYNIPARMIAMWNQVPRLPWQTDEYYAQEAAVLTQQEFKRVHRNTWSSASSAFVPEEWWDACQVNNIPILTNETIVIALDAATTNDSFAMVGVSGWDGDRYAVRFARVWYPPKGDKIQFSGDGSDQDDTPEAVLRRILEKYSVAEVAYDPYQLEDLAGRLKRDMLTHVFAFNQAKPRSIADKELYDMIRDRKIMHSGQVELREHVVHANQTKEDKQLRIVKRSEKMKIDAAVALSMAIARARFWQL